jgi:transglutaminase-like putative cysteine protease
MSALDRSATQPANRTGPARVRPIGWSPGTGILIGAWVGSAAIARLTGASAVILLLAATLVGFVFEIAAGWWATRSVRIVSIVAPHVVAVDEPCRLLISTESRRSARAAGRRRIVVLQPDGTPANVSTDANGDTGDTGDTADTGDTGDTSTMVCFTTAGVLTELTVRVEVAGPAGLFWWRRSGSVAIDDLHIAPVGHGPLVDVEASTSTADGSMTTQRGNHDGEIDGVRPWRQGDSTSSVHWATSLRTDELIVHDRLTTAEQRWVVDLDDSVSGGGRAEAGRLRWTLDEARHRGHAVAIRTADGATHPVTDADASARWSALAAQAHADAHRGNHRSTRWGAGILQRQFSLRSPKTETDTTITGVARWSAAAAALASMGMLIGALGASSAELALLVGSVALGAVVSLWVARRHGRRPVLLQVAIVAAILIALGMIAVQAADVDSLLAALRGPLPNVLMLLVVLHGFETVDRRTLRVHLAITFVLASYAAGLRIDAALGWWLAAWAVPFVVSMLTTARRQTERYVDRRAQRRRPAPGSARTVGAWIVSIGGVAVATLAVLSVVPVPDGPARLGLPALSSNAPAVDTPGGLARPDGSTAAPATSGDPNRGRIGNLVGYPGFTETLDTSVRGDLGDEIVMRVRAPQPAFWRGQTFTEFDGRTWTVSPDLGGRQDGPIIDVQPTIGDAIGPLLPTEEFVQTYYVEQDHPNVVFAASRPVQVFFDGALWTRPDGALRSDVTLTKGSVYTVISERVQVDANMLRAQGDLGEFFAGFREMAGNEIDPFLAIPESTTQRTIDLASSLRTPGESTYDTILAYEAWLGANTEYDLDAPVPPDGADAVDDFLFESQLGYCEQIASTLTIMLRSQGVPARLATGYVPGERDRVSGVWNVRSSDAHAWVEVWFPQTGWQAFDPTAEVPLAADAGNGTVGGDLIGATLSSIASHRVEIGLAVLAAAFVWGLVRLIVLVRYRRRRGRWGLLQDRFGELASAVEPDPSPRDGTGVVTNVRIAATVADQHDREAARLIADELDRVAFDPSWVDDDERFERTRSALATLQRSRR